VHQLRPMGRKEKNCRHHCRQPNANDDPAPILQNRMVLSQSISELGIFTKPCVFLAPITTNLDFVELMT